ncbi:MAG TPA: glutamate 5-kinase [Dinghuibacter sp.]|uniref:glutamate 5-kinase n=1 Tax=Dinghuibacter sp. TaxID=2024697 RepID=UPI002CDF8341|nr:glutamate 5-kinase [Dinghuibacter sp.]HTJ12517.1 glutamate 5-kinase [Dinghuibacter sp.]
MTEYKRLVIKIGSNVLTGPDGLPDTRRMERLVDDIAALKKEGREVVVVSSGAVASGRALVRVPERADEVSARQLLAAVGQVQLIRRYADLFRERELVCAQVLVTKEDFRDKTHYKNMLSCLSILLAEQIIPVVNENDVISVSELMFTDNDELAGLLASMIGADALVILTNVDGLYTGDPRDPASTLIAEVPPTQADLSGYISTQKSNFGRGGMLTKSSMARKTARLGISVHVANGKKDGALPGVLAGTVPHTHFLPLRRSSGQKRWIAHAGLSVKGQVEINEGARAALLGSKASSLLPVGIVRIHGEFGRNDVIEIVDASGRVIGIGLARYGSETARGVMGKRDQQALVHYDYLYIQQ